MIDDPLEREKWFNQNFHVIQPDMERAFLRLFFNPMLPWAESCPDELLKKIFAPPSDYNKAMFMHLIDFLIFKIFDKKATLKMMNELVSKALPEVKEAYDVIIRDGGGWSYIKGGLDKRQTAVLSWFNQQESRLSYIKESDLEDQALYDDGGGQEKRNFTTRLLMKIIERKVSKEITFQKIHDLLKSLKKTQQGGWLGKVLASEE